MQVYNPKPYQVLATKHILDNQRCSLFAEMGLGKTVSTLSAINVLNVLHGCKTLVIAPLRVARSTWPDEVKKWAHLSHLTVSVIAGTVKDREKAINTDADVYTTNYENLPWLIERLACEWPFDVIVADESTKLKSFRLRQGSKRARILSKVAFKSERFINLTGTPSPNGLQDLWGQQWFIDKGIALGTSFRAFQDRWFVSKQIGRDANMRQFSATETAHAEITERLRPTTLTLRTEDYFDLDKPIVNNIYVDMPTKAHRMYKDFEKEMRIALESGGHVVADNSAALTMKCLQLANGAIYINDQRDYEEVHDEKLQALDSIVEEACGSPVLVAYHFDSDIKRIMKAFPSARRLDKDPKTIEAWNRGEIPILLAHPASAGHGLNLQYGGHRLVVFGHWWSLEEYQQIIERVGPVRQAQAGFKRPVFIHHILTRGTVDELVMERRESKKSVQELLMKHLSEGE